MNEEKSAYKYISKIVQVQNRIAVTKRNRKTKTGLKKKISSERYRSELAKIL